MVYQITNSKEITKAEGSIFPTGQCYCDTRKIAYGNQGNETTIITD